MMNSQKENTMTEIKLGWPMQTTLLSRVEKMCKIGVYKGLFKNA